MARRTEPVSMSGAEAELSYAASCLTGLLVLVFVWLPPSSSHSDFALLAHLCNKRALLFFFLSSFVSGNARTTNEGVRVSERVRGREREREGEIRGTERKKERKKGRPPAAADRLTD